MEKPLITVIVPVYKVEKYLQKCIDSLVKQSYTNLEILLVDDGSPDECGRICDDNAIKDKRIRVIHKKNGGLSSARNTGIDVAKGEYLSFVDSDDFVSEFFIETLYNAINKTGAKVSSTGYKINRFYDGEEGRIDFSSKPLDIDVKRISVSEALELLLYQRIPSGAPLRLYHKSIFTNLRFPEGWVFEDVATIHKAFINSNYVALVDASIYAYRTRNDGIVRSKFSQSKMVVIPITNSLFKEVKDYSSELMPAAASRSFAQNYHVFLQIPFFNTEDLKKVWTEMKKYRGIVIKDKNRYIRKKNKIGALSSYLGMRTAYLFGKCYLLLR